ncbi:hypothetical protein [Actinokineospora alba]|uniref:hypothetical protein n=1 Tax=Actinokineospora alba TaxID=504798 RepID=UPI00105B5526|nr:hypothetical protein [Actinokineospora alba]
MIRFWAARRRVHILTVLALVVSLAGCESSPPAAPVTPNPGAEQDRGLPPVPPATPATPNPRADGDVGLRQVPHTGGLALVFAQPEFASQVLCQAIDKQDWEKVLGGRVARILSRPPIAGCTIAADTAEVFLSLRGPGPETYEQGKTIGGRPAEEHPGDIRTWIAVTLSDSPRGRTSLTAEFHPKVRSPRRAPRCHCSAGRSKRSCPC